MPRLRAGYDAFMYWTLPRIFENYCGLVVEADSALRARLRARDEPRPSFWVLPPAYHDHLSEGAFLCFCRDFNLLGGTVTLARLMRIFRDLATPNAKVRARAAARV